MLNYKALKKVNSKNDPLYVKIGVNKVYIMNKQGYYAGIIPIEDYKKYIEGKFKYLYLDGNIVDQIENCLNNNLTDPLDIIDTNISVELETCINARFLKIKGGTHSFINIDFFNIVKGLPLLGSETYKPVILNTDTHKFLILPMRVNLYKYPCLTY